ncbi:MAG: UDP-3-O-(3-hydroxymyristoyl)glucosamine N-acyltransferase [Omnitrophica bacterium RBG_13_46_9]|nr:MAG: UDP-3-O-(3-hydroxymyristoyl)glucosamine N-acyltransferase [Omnitrophica bacterium RBG_13_46_9]
MTLEALASELKGELIGDRDLSVRNICDIEEAEKGDLAFITGKKYASFLETTRASCVIVPNEIEKARVSIIKCKNPNLAFKRAVELIAPDHIPLPKGVHKTASIGNGVALGREVALGAYAVVEDGAEIGDGTVIYAHCYVGCATKIGKNCIIYPNTTIRENVKIGDRVIVHPGCVIGGDGYGYERTQRGHEKIPHLGDVIIEDDVELGACVTVDRAKIAHTRIGRGTKIDNLVQIAHNVTIGENCIIVSQCGISGSTKIGNNVIMAGQVGLVDHIEIGDNVMIGAKSGLMKSVPPNTIVWGIPARPAEKTKMMHILSYRLPEIYERLKAVEEHLGIKKSSWKSKKQ